LLQLYHAVLYRQFGLSKGHSAAFSTRVMNFPNGRTIDYEGFS
jgi:hypothetical protein